MNDEFNKTPEETQSFTEIHTVDEYKEVKDNVIKDNPSPTEYGENKEKTKPKKSVISLSLTSIIAVVGTVSIANGTIINKTPDIEATLDVTTTSTTVDYEVVLSEFKDGVKVVLSNNFTNREVELTDTSSSGSIENLRPNSSYTISVVVPTTLSTSTITSTKVKTKDVEPEKELVTKLISVTSECKCNYDGCFHFKMDLIDENNYYSDFKATLTDSYGTTSTISFTNYNEEQKIDVVEHNLRGSEDSVVFKIECDSNETKEVKRIVLYEKYVTI